MRGRAPAAPRTVVLDGPIGDRGPGVFAWHVRHWFGSPATATATATASAERTTARIAPHVCASPYTDDLRRLRRVGKRKGRVHVITRPLSEYLRLEFSRYYAPHVAAGENARILDATDRQNPLAGVQDFWMVDRSEMVLMHPKVPLNTFTVCDRALATIETTQGSLALRDCRDVHSLLDACGNP
ncbi:DUF6879 family protein [Streptomyces sp. NPDC018045]|uniref:DUF6879 family protein n=1 Tax=Streptomyces sp. NPDC018045 TaxID=3365037 RepID=UPI0037AAF50D